MKLRLHLLGLITLAFLASCSVSNDVATGWGIQKRKYNDGFYVSFGKNFDRSGNKLASDNHAVSEDLTVREEEAIIQPMDEPADQPAPVMEGNPLSAIEEIPAGTDETYPYIADDPAVTIEPADFTRPELNRLSRNKQLIKINRGYQMDTIYTKISHAQSPEGVLLLILLIILCFILPPVSVAVVDGISTRFWIDLIFFLIGWGVGWWLFGGALAYLCALIAVIYALLIVLAVI